MSTCAFCVSLPCDDASPSLRSDIFSKTTRLAGDAPAAHRPHRRHGPRVRVSPAPPRSGGGGCFSASAHSVAASGRRPRRARGSRAKATAPPSVFGITGPIGPCNTEDDTCGILRRRTGPDGAGVAGAVRGRRIGAWRTNTAPSATPLRSRGGSLVNIYNEWGRGRRRNRRAPIRSP